MGGDYGYQRTENASPSAHGRILLLEDSLGDARSTYLAERVSQLVTIDERHYTGPDIQDVVRGMHSDLVIPMHNQVSMLGNPQFSSEIWVNVAAAVARRDRVPSTADDG